MSLPSGAEAFWLMIPAFLFALTIVVFFHELGHFLVARWCGVRVEAFSIGFGSEIFGWTDRRGTRWRFAWIPLGGYVKFMGDEDPASRPDAQRIARMSESEREGAFHLKPLWKRAAVVAAGPIASFLLGIFLLALVMMTFGQVMSPPRIGSVEAGSPAEAAGLRTGDLVVSVNDAPVEAYEDLRRIERDNPGTLLRIVIQRGEERRSTEATPILRQDPAAGPSGWLGVAEFVPARIGEIVKGSRAEQAGLRARDRIISIDGAPIASFADVLRIVGENPEKPLSIVVERGAERLTIAATPEAREEKTSEGTRQVGRLGMSLPTRADSEGAFRRVHGPIEAVGIGIERTVFIVDQTLSYIGKIIAGSESTNQLSGPFGIAQMAGQVAALGFSFLLQLTAFLSISIGLFNLFPIPLLDGGHLLFYAIEGLRGRPLSERAQRAGFGIGIAIVLMLLAVASYNDVVRFSAGMGQ